MEPTISFADAARAAANAIYLAGTVREWDDQDKLADHYDSCKNKLRWLGSGEKGVPKSALFLFPLPRHPAPDSKRCPGCDCQTYYECLLKVSGTGK